MYFRVFCLIFLLKVFECQNDFYGTVELVKHTPRRSRLLSDFVDNAPKSASPVYVAKPSPPPQPSTTSEPRSSSTSATTNGIPLDASPKPTIDTLRKYARIFKMDTKSLTEQQRTLLERIVERVARLGGSLESDTKFDDNNINDQEGRARNRNRNVRKNANKKLKTNSTTSEIDGSLTQTTPIATKTIKRTSAGVIAHKIKGGKSKVTQMNDLTLSNATTVDLGNISTTSIVNILSTDNARENVYSRRPPPSSSLSLQQQQHDSKAPNSKTPSVKPTKYHFYPHNQHIYLLPECAIQQVCNAVYVRLNYTQPLCACPARYRDPCSASIDEDDLHTTKLIGDQQKKAITLAKTCESTTEMRECRSPRDWSLLALQNTRTGKSHYLVICRCPDNFNLEGPMAHDQPTYASVPGIRVFGMMCVKPANYGNGVIRRPQSSPPKRNQQFQPQSPYYQRYKKHATVMPPSQSRTEVADSGSKQTEYTDFTTRGINSDSMTPENREADDINLDEITEERTSTLDATSTSTVDTTITPNDSAERAEDETANDENGNSRVKRMIDAFSDSSDRFNDDDENETEFLSSRNSRSTDDWPDIPWDEIRKQINDIKWD